MAYVADLHIHSRFSRACSQQLNIPNLVEWANLKGINLLGTGDFLHPLWLTELKSQLTEDGSGFLTFKNSPVKFVLTVEIASIYSHKGKGRRVHNLVFMPDLDCATRFQQALFTKRATLASDGRPIVGIPSKDLLYMALEVSSKALFVPAHIWTPWFGVFGSESGYDSLKDCFEDLTDKVYAIETGLSSDPAMNWRVGELDTRSIISCSDAHSLPNIGRESTVVNRSLQEGFQGLLEAVKSQDLVGTIEFYPEEGKYHYTGHRNCNVKYSPEQTRQNSTICPKCGRGLTVGVMERVETLASRSSSELKVRNEEGMIKSEALQRPGYKMLVPLLQIIAEAFGSMPTSQKVLNEYKKLVMALGGEIKVLTKVDISEVAKISGSKIAEGIDKVRKGDLVIDPGYDGVYGVVKIWSEEKEEQAKETTQIGLF
ncbi:DNA helicase UvrD [Candidatus Daviesbacteria bacterium]|nr:DNA helicase UvrD [Candidatus Daviesbacteria bacterium]